VFQRDYILRIIEQLGQALRELRKRIVGGAEEGADLRAELAAVAARAAIDIELARKVDRDTLRLIVFPAGEPDPARCWFIAELMYLDGLRLRTSGRQAEARAAFDRSALLFSWIAPDWDAPAGFPPPGDRIDEIRRMVDH
jgi:hypothetical protein